MVKAGLCTVPSSLGAVRRTDLHSIMRVGDRRSQQFRSIAANADAQDMRRVNIYTDYTVYKVPSMEACMVHVCPGLDVCMQTTRHGMHGCTLPIPAC